MQETQPTTGALSTTVPSKPTLSQETRDALKGLNKPVRAICFFAPPEDQVGIVPYATALLTEFQNYTSQLTVEFVDPDQHPERARQYSVTQYQTVVFESGDQRRLVPPLDILKFDDSGNAIGRQGERVFTDAIMEVASKAH